MSLANKIQHSNMKDKKVLSELIDDLSLMTGKEINKDKKEKIINTIIEDKIPKDIDNMI